MQNYDFEEIETENHELTREISIRKSELDQQTRENKELRSRFESLQRTFVSVRQNFTFAEEQEYIRLQAKYQELS